MRRLYMRILAAAATCLIAACSPRVRPLESANVKQRAIIFVPGFKGTALYEEATQKTVWVTLGQAVFGSQTLALNEPDIGIDEAIDLSPSGVLDSIPVIPWVYSYMGYGSCFQVLQRAFGDSATIVAFPYDWRRDNITAVRELDALVRTLRKNGAHKIDIVSHSMGALLTSYYLRYGTQEPETAEENWAGATLVNNVVTAGAPFRGTMVILRDMQLGTVQLLNDDILDATALSSFPSSYQLLPAPGLTRIYSSKLEPMPGMLYDANNWNYFGWGLLKDGGALPPDVRVARLEQTRKQLQRAEELLRKINAPRRTEPEFHARLLNVSGEGIGTSAYAIWHEPERRLIFTEAQLRASLPGLGSDLLFKDGDGIVDLESAALPEALAEAYQAREVRVGESHSLLCSGDDAAREIIDFLAAR